MDGSMGQELAQAFGREAFESVDWRGTEATDLWHGHEDLWLQKIDQDVNRRMDLACEPKLVTPIRISSESTIGYFDWYSS